MRRRRLFQWVFKCLVFYCCSNREIPIFSQKYALRQIMIMWNLLVDCEILYFIGRASRYKFLLITNLTHFFMYLFISCLYMFRASQCSSSGDRIVLIRHLVWLVCVSDCLVCRPPGRHTKQSHRLIIPDDVLIQFDLLMMSTVMLKTCRDMK